MTPKPNVKIDLYADWIEYIKGELLQAGHTVKPDADGFDICKQFFNLRWRRIISKPRTIVVSKELLCPSESKEGLKMLSEKVERGDDLNPHVSRGLKKASLNDGMLNDWGIYHLHLGIKLEADGFVERTGSVLFARITSDKVYFVDIQNHGRRADKHVWTNKEIMEIVHRNWPESLAEHQSGFKLRESDRLNQEQQTEFRELGITVPLDTADGTTYHPPGGGSTMDSERDGKKIRIRNGTNLNIAMTCNQNAKQLKQREEKLKSNIEAIAAEIFKDMGYNGNIFDFKLEIVNEKFIVVERNCQAKLELFDVYDFTSS